METQMNKYRAVSNLTVMGNHPHLDRRFTSQCAVQEFNTVAQAKAFLTFGGGEIRDLATDKIVAVVQPLDTDAMEAAHE